MKVKLGTFKIDAHGNQTWRVVLLGLCFNLHMRNKGAEVYVTIFDKHSGVLIFALLTKYGFLFRLKRKIFSTINRQEGAYFKNPWHGRSKK